MIRKSKCASGLIRRKREAARRCEWETYQTLLILQHLRATNSPKFAKAQEYCWLHGMTIA